MSHPSPAPRPHAEGSRQHSRAAFKGFELYPNLVLGCTFGRSSPHCTVSRVSRSLSIASSPSSTSTLPQSHPSVVPGARGCRCHFRSFHRRQQLALPHRGCRVSHVSYIEAGRTAYLSKAQDVGDHLHRRSWTVNEIDLRIHMVSQPSSPLRSSGDAKFPGLTWIHLHYRVNSRMSPPSIGVQDVARA